MGNYCWRASFRSVTGGMRGYRFVSARHCRWEACLLAAISVSVGGGAVCLTQRCSLVCYKSEEVKAWVIQRCGWVMACIRQRVPWGAREGPGGLTESYTQEAGRVRSTQVRSNAPSRLTSWMAAPQCDANVSGRVHTKNLWSRSFKTSEPSVCFIKDDRLMAPVAPNNCTSSVEQPRSG